MEQRLSSSDELQEQATGEQNLKRQTLETVHYYNTPPGGCFQCIHIHNTHKKAKNLPEEMNNCEQ